MNRDDEGAGPAPPAMPLTIQIAPKTIVIAVLVVTAAWLLFGRAVGLPPVAILLALLAGGELIGIAGALLAVPATVILWVVAAELLPTRTPDATSGGISSVDTHLEESTESAPVH